MTLSYDELKRVEPMIIAVIGPTNEGKTSVLRTLSGDADFGEVNAFTGTTLRAEIQKFFYKGIEILQLVDTPGFQMSSDILERLESLSTGAQRVSVPTILDQIPDKDDDFRHDLRAWREINRCDLAILVVNVMETPEQSLSRDSLSLLAMSGKPLLALFNNVPDGDATVVPQNDFTELWRQSLQSRNFTNIQTYDAHRRNFRHEIELFEKIIALANAPLTSRALQQELDERIGRENRRLDESRRILVQLLIDIAAMEETRGNIPDDQKDATQIELVQNLLARICQREHDAHLELLRIWEFHPGILRRRALNAETVAKRSNDLLGEKSLEDITAGGAIGAGVGASIGLALDVALAGLSLGTGTVIGALVGGAIGGGSQGVFRMNYDQGEKRITVKSQVDTLLALLSRGLDLTRKLQNRGKAMDDTNELFLSLDSKNTDLPEIAALFAPTQLPRIQKLWARGLRWMTRGTLAEESVPFDLLLEKITPMLPDVAKRS